MRQNNIEREHTGAASKGMNATDSPTIYPTPNMLVTSALDWNGRLGRGRVSLKGGTSVLDLNREVTKTLPGKFKSRARWSLSEEESLVASILTRLEHNHASQLGEIACAWENGLRAINIGKVVHPGWSLLSTAAHPLATPNNQLTLSFSLKNVLRRLLLFNFFSAEVSGGASALLSYIDNYYWTRYVITRSCDLIVRLTAC